MSAPAVVAIVDDDESVCRSLSRLLQQAGFRAASFGSGEDFLAQAQTSRYDCLLVDVRLRTMSGIELHERLVAQGETIPVIYITAHDDPVARERAVSQGCAGFFRKTDAGQDILEAIRRVTAVVRRI